MANKVYTNPETVVEFSGDAGADVAFSVEGLSPGAGRQSAAWDRGASARATRFAWRAHTQFQSGVQVGEALEIYLKTSDGTYPDNDDGTGDIAVSAEAKLRNLRYIGAIECDEAAASIVTVASGVVEIEARYIHVVWWNRTAAALNATDTNSGFFLQPIPDEIQ